MDFTSYEQYLNRMPLSKHTKRTYLTRVRLFLQWLEGSIDGSKVLTNEVDRDFAIRDYRVNLLTSGAKPATVNASLAALDSYFMHIGLGKAKVRRQDLPATAPKALEHEELRRVLKAIAHCSSRDRAICMILLHTGIRISELAALNVADVFVSARKGELTIRNGKGNRHRSIPLNTDLREVLQIYLSAPRTPDEPLFVSRLGKRLSTSAIDHLVRQIANDCGVKMSCHSMRHTMITKLVRSGLDIVVIAELAGHSRLETTRRYSLPTVHDKIRAVERLNYDPT